MSSVSLLCIPASDHADVPRANPLSLLWLVLSGGVEAEGFGVLTEIDIRTTLKKNVAVYEEERSEQRVAAKRAPEQTPPHADVEALHAAE